MTSTTLAREGDEDAAAVAVAARAASSVSTKQAGPGTHCCSSDGGSQDLLYVLPPAVAQMQSEARRRQGFGVIECLRLGTIVWIAAEMK